MKREDWAAIRSTLRVTEYAVSGSVSTSTAFTERTRGISDPKPSCNLPWFRGGKLPVRRVGIGDVGIPSVSGCPVTVVRMTLLNVLETSKS